MALGLNLNTGQLSCHYIAEISLNVTLNYSQQQPGTDGRASGRRTDEYHISSTGQSNWAKMEKSDLKKDKYKVILYVISILERLNVHQDLWLSK